MRPIWKDYAPVISTSEECDFVVKAGSSIIYTGRAVRRPDAQNIAVRLNDIIRDHLSQAFPSLEQDGFTAAPLAGAFSVEVNDVQQAGDTFYLDWSYLNRAAGAKPSDPVDGIIDPRMPIVQSVYAAGSISTPDGTITATGPGNIVYDASEHAGEDISVGGISYHIRETCAQYALYYVNGFGGWDALVLAEKETMSDAFTRHSYRHEYNNAAAERGETNYLTEAVRSWELHTGFLTDAQSARMGHLLGSTQVVLYDLTARRAVPVVLTDGGWTRQTRLNQGRTMYQYTINVRLAQELLRM